MIKKIVLLLVTFVLLVGNSKPLQAQAHEQGNVFTSAGVIWGVRGYRYSNISSNMLGSIALDYSLSDNVSLGGVLGRSMFNVESGYLENPMNLYALRLGFHLSSSDYFDPYINLSLGTIYQSNSFYKDTYSIYGINFGTRYLVKKSFGIYTDVGIGAGTVSFGLFDKF